MNKLVEEAPYHPGYEDAVVSPAQKYKGVDPAKMIWNNNELIRQQADRIAELEKELKHYKMAWNMAENELENQTKPLSVEEVKNLHEQTSWWGISDPVKFARAIEERHGIK